MDTPRDELRRDLRELDAEHRATMPRRRDDTLRLLDPASGADDDTKRRAILGGFDRRRFFRLGGATLLGGALLAACGDDDGGATAATAGDGSTTVEASSDAVVLRTAASLENLAVAAYRMAIDSGMVTDPAIAAAATLFMDHHVQHADFWNALAQDAGGRPFTEPNPALLEALGPDVEAALRSQDGIVALAYRLEVTAAQTYVGVVGELDDAALDKAFLSVGGVEARHAAVLGQVMALGGAELFPQAFLGVAMAVPAGTGVS